MNEYYKAIKLDNSTYSAVTIVTSVNYRIVVIFKRFNAAVFSSKSSYTFLLFNHYNIFMQLLIV